MPEWLPGRLEQARRQERESILAELGVADPAKAKAFVQAGIKAEEDAKTAGQKLGETSTALQAANAELARHREVTKNHAERQLSGLTAEQQAAVKRLAGDDPARQLDAIDALKPTWGSATPAAPPAPAAPAAAPPADPPAAATPAKPPATTAPPVSAAPPPGPQTSQPDHKAVYRDLQKSNPVHAAAYLNVHRNAIYPQQQ